MSAPQEHLAGPTQPGDGVGVWPGPGATRPPAPPQFSFVVSRALGTVVVTAHGLLDPNSGRALGDALLDLIDQQGNLVVVVDVADLHLSDQISLLALAPAASAAARRGGRLSFADPSEAVARGLVLTGLAGMVTVTAGRSRSHPSPLAPAQAVGNGGRRAAMAQHPAGSGVTRIPITTDSQGASQ